MTKRYFFDTYALVELYKSNPAYEKYKEGIIIFLNKLNLLEFSYYLIREGKENEATQIFNKYSRHS